MLARGRHAFSAAERLVREVVSLENQHLGALSALELRKLGLDLFRCSCICWGAEVVRKAATRPGNPRGKPGCSGKVEKLFGDKTIRG